MQIRNFISQIITSHLALQQKSSSSSSSNHHHHDDVVDNFLQAVSTKDTTTKSNSSNSISRRFLLRNCIAATISTTAVSTTTTAVYAAETVGKDPNCIDKSCLGVWDGLLADCPHGGNILLKGGGGAGCTSSQDDTPGTFSEPWDYSEAPNQSLDWEEQMRLLLPTIQLVCGKRGDQVRVLLNEGRYLRVVFTDGKTSEKSVGEFYATPNDTTIQFRLGSLNENNGGGGSPRPVGSLRNIERAEMIRKQLKYTKLPVLRNRKRTLFFVESDFDTFGPGSAALGPPAEMKTGEIDGRIDVDPKLNKVDVLQQFPIAK